jgi:hypothetical protein
MCYAIGIQYGCCAHNLNLIHKHSFSDIKSKYEMKIINDLINNCKELVTYFKQPGLQKRFKTTLKQSIDVLWDLTLIMFESIKMNFNHIKALSINNTKLVEIIVNIFINISRLA